jgi:hypothetical protein
MPKMFYESYRSRGRIMPKKLPVTIDHLAFDSQKDAVEYFKNILRGYSTGAFLSGQDLKDVLALLSLHPRASHKVGFGVRKIFVENNDYGNKCFNVQRIDGSIEDFSYLKCIRGEHKPFTQFSNACRRAVKNDIVAFKVNYFWKNQNENKTIKCLESGEQITISEGHVDHVAPLTFSILVQQFIFIKNIILRQVEYRRRGICGIEFADSGIKNDFQEWHSKNAILRVIRNTENLKTSYLGRSGFTMASGF